MLPFPSPLSSPLPFPADPDIAPWSAFAPGVDTPAAKPGGFETLLSPQATPLSPAAQVPLPAIVPRSIVIPLPTILVVSEDACGAASSHLPIADPARGIIGPAPAETPTPIPSRGGMPDIIAAPDSRQSEMPLAASGTPDTDPGVRGEAAAEQAVDA